MLTFQQCLEMISKARISKSSGDKRVKLAPNTYLIAGDFNGRPCFHVRLYSTNIVSIFEGNVWRLNSGGWQTVTTKERINRYSPVRVNSVKCQWLAGGKPYQDGMMVSL